MGYLWRFAGASSARGRLAAPGQGVPGPGLKALERGPADGWRDGHPPAGGDRKAAGRSRAADAEGAAAGGERAAAGRRQADDRVRATASGDRGISGGDRGAAGYCRYGARSVRSAGDRRSRAVLAWCQYG